MNIVNPELDLDVEVSEWSGSRRHNPAFRQAVVRLFGRADRVVVRAVDEFLDKKPGLLDQHGLRMIAAASRHFDDANHVAHMIDSLPISKMNVALAPIDLDRAAGQFGLVLPSFRATTGRKLVLDLVRRGALHVLENSPIERVPEEGRALVAAELRARLKSERGGREALLESDFVAGTDIDEALDELESSVRRFSELTDEEDRIFELRMVDRRLGLILGDQLEDVIDDEQLLRAWSLAVEFRASHRYNLEQISVSVSTNPRLVALEGHRVLEFLDSRSNASASSRLAEYSRSRLLNLVELPEEIARIAVSKGAHFEPDENMRIGWARILHYTGSNELMEPMSNDEADAFISYLVEPEQWNGRWIEEVGSHKTLARIARHVGRMHDFEIAALARNPNLQPSHVASIVGRLNVEQFDWDETALPDSVVELMLSRAIDDSTLARLIDRLPTPMAGQKSLQVMVMAACNRNSGVLVDQLIETHGSTLGREWHDAVVRSVAFRTASTFMHTALVGRALETNDDFLALNLASNGVIEAGTLEQLIERFPDVSNAEVLLQPPMYNLLFSETRAQPYDQNDVIDLIRSGRAPSGRASKLVDHLASTRGPSQRALVSQLVDDGFVSKEDMVDGTGDRDLHLALFYATQPSILDVHGNLVNLDAQMLAETADAVSAARADLPNDRGVNSWSQLPNRDDIVLPASHLHPLLAERVVEGLQLQLPRTRRDVIELSREMHNCLGGYVDGITNGRSLLAFARTEDDVFAVMWDLEREHPDGGVHSPGPGHDTEVSSLPIKSIRVLEMNSKFNKGRVPPDFAAALQRITEQFNSGTLETVVPLDKEPTSHSRPPRRTKSLSLPAPAAEESRPERAVDAPSWLAGSGDGLAREQLASTPESDGTPDHRFETPAGDGIGHQLT